MGLGKTLGIMLTQQVKCDNCGAVIVDGKGVSGPFDMFGNPKVNFSPSAARYGDGVGVLNTLMYGSKKRVLCPMCQAIEKHTNEMEQAMAIDNARQEEHLALEKENLRLENELLKKKLDNEARAIRAAPVESRTAPANRAANFCSGCGNPLKQNARFCVKCGKRMD